MVLLSLAISFAHIESHLQGYLQTNQLAEFFSNLFANKLQSLEKLKGVHVKMRPPKSLKCSKSKTLRARKQKLSQHVYIIR